MKKQKKKRQSRFHNTKSFFEEIFPDSKYSTYRLVGVRSSPESLLWEFVGFSWEFSSYMYKLNYPLIKEVWKIVLRSRKCTFLLLFSKYRENGFHLMEMGKIWCCLLKTTFSTRLISTSSLKENFASFGNTLFWFSLRLWKMWSWRHQSLSLSPRLRPWSWRCSEECVWIIRLNSAFLGQSVPGIWRPLG